MFIKMYKNIQFMRKNIKTNKLWKSQIIGTWNIPTSFECNYCYYYNFANKLRKCHVWKRRKEIKSCTNLYEYVICSVSYVFYIFDIYILGAKKDLYKLNI